MAHATRPVATLPSAAERATRAAFAAFLDANPAHGPLLTGSAAAARQPAPQPARKAVAA